MGYKASVLSRRHSRFDTRASMRKCLDHLNLFAFDLFCGLIDGDKLILQGLKFLMEPCHLLYLGESAVDARRQWLSCHG